MYSSMYLSFFFFNDTATTEIYTLSLHDALPIYQENTDQFLFADLGRPYRHGHGQTAHDQHNGVAGAQGDVKSIDLGGRRIIRSEEHTSELQSLRHLVCRLLLEKKKITTSQPLSD